MEESTQSNQSETIYGTPDDHHVMSEKVQSLAATVYQEFERMIKRYDEDVVNELMPLVVGILESLDVAYGDKQESEVELELLRDDNEQLLTQYEREKQLRRSSEQKYLEVEDTVEAEQKELTSKLESLESIVRMLELKSRNASDHVSRLEDKESEMKKEYTKLHERYTELFKSHMDYMERAKLLMGADRISDLAHSPRSTSKSGFNLPILKPYNVIIGGSGETPNLSDSTPTGFDIKTPMVNQSHDSNLSLRSELESRYKAGASREMADKCQITDSIDRRETSTGTSATPDVEKKDLFRTNSQTMRNSDSLFDELNTDVVGDVDFGADLTGNEVSPGDYASSDEDDKDDKDDKDTYANDNFFGMGKEVENLILENTELLATKNALNIVKDDLIAKVDELMSEQEILREEIQSLQIVKSRLHQRISQLEEELKKTKEELDQKTEVAQGEEDDVPMAHRKRFTRVEMARVLMERNQYKERLMELQEAVRWTEMIRASREHPDLVPKKKSSIWGFFSSLVTTEEDEDAAPPTRKKANAPAAQIV